jgi:predicted nucleotidyltransferase
VDIAIRPGDRQILINLLNQYIPDIAVWVFGSRVQGVSRPWSDLDIVVFISPEQAPQLSLLKEALDESDLPFRVDILEWYSLPENFKKNIEACHLPFNPRQK